MDDDEGAPKAAPNRTIQIDALTDVQLVDNEEDEAPLISRAPPPLPPRKPPSLWLLGGVVVITGVLGALGAHFLIPSAPVSVPPPPAEPAEPAEEAVRHVPLGEDFVILASPEPDAGLTPAPAPR